MSDYLLNCKSLLINQILKIKIIIIYHFLGLFPGEALILPVGDYLIGELSLTSFPTIDFYIATF